jgi:hypothetical protein
MAKKQVKKSKPAPRKSKSKTLTAKTLRELTGGSKVASCYVYGIKNQVSGKEGFECLPD